MPATYMSRSCSFRERQKSRTPRTLGYFYPVILSVRQFDDSGAFAQGLVARYICPIFNCSLCYRSLLICTCPFLCGGKGQPLLLCGSSGISVQLHLWSLLPCRKYASHSFCTLRLSFVPMFSQLAHLRVNRDQIKRIIKILLFQKSELFHSYGNR